MTTNISHTTAYTTQHNTMSPVNSSTEMSHDDHTTEYEFWGNTGLTTANVNSENMNNYRQQVASKYSKSKQTVAVMPQDQNYHNFELVNHLAPNHQGQHSVIPTVPYIAYAATTPATASPMQTAIVAIASPLNSPTNNNPPAAQSFPALYPPSMQGVVLPNSSNHLEQMSKRPKISPISFSHNGTSTGSLSPQSSVDSMDFSQSVPCNYDFEHHMDFEFHARLAAEEDKRRRNTAASARFRIKKKMREQTLEKTAKDMAAKAETLENRVKELELEIKWLRSLIVEKDARLLDTERPAITEKSQTEKGQKTTTVTDEGESERSSRQDPVEPKNAQK